MKDWNAYFPEGLPWKKEEDEPGKEKQYQKDFRPEVQLIKGLDSFLQRSNKAGIKMAIDTAATIYNVDFVLDGLVGLTKNFISHIAKAVIIQQSS